MADRARATTFVAGSDRCLGTDRLSLLSRGQHLAALASALDRAERLRRLGTMPVIGDPRTPVRWRDEAAAEWVVHLTPPIHPGHPFLTRTAARAQARLSLDANLLDSVSSGSTRPIVPIVPGAVLSSLRLRTTGFRLDRPTLDDGIGRGLSGRS